MKYTKVLFTSAATYYPKKLDIFEAIFQSTHSLYRQITRKSDNYKPPTRNPFYKAIVSLGQSVAQFPNPASDIVFLSFISSLHVLGNLTYYGFHFFPTLPKLLLTIFILFSLLLVLYFVALSRDWGLDINFGNPNSCLLEVKELNDNRFTHYKKYCLFRYLGAILLKDGRYNLET